jgi:hypothetical protein
MAEFALQARSHYSNAFQDVTLTAEFSGPGGARRVVRGFYDGGSLWRVCFMPDRQGVWTAVTRSEPRDPGLDGQTLRLRCTAPRTKGPIRADPKDPRHLVYANGEHFFHLGDTVYNLFSGKASDEQALEFIRDAAHWRINKFRVLVWNWGEDDDLPFEVAGGVPNPDRYDFAYYRRVERFLGEMQRNGIQAGLILGIGRREAVRGERKIPVTDAQMDAYLRYTAARLAAFDNVYWELDNEYGHPSHAVRSEENLERCAGLVRAEDPYAHPIACSVCCALSEQSQRFPLLDLALFHGKFRDDAQADHDYMLRMRDDPSLRSGQAPLRGIAKPIIHDEIAYEQRMEARSFAGNGTKPDLIRKQAWADYLAGCYWTYGAAPDRWAGLLNKYRVDAQKHPELAHFEYDESAFRWFPAIARFFEKVPYWRMEPTDDLVTPGNYCLAERGREYVVQAPSGGAVEVRLDPPGPYEAIWYNPREGDSQRSEVVPAGVRSFTAPDANDWILHLRLKATP